MRPRSIALAAVLAATLAGCGTAASSDEDFEGAEADVAQVVEDLEEAASENEPRRVCTALLATEVSRELGGGCIQAVENAFDDADTPALSVTSVRITGDRARARVRPGLDEDRDADEILELVRESGDWRIARFAGAG